MKLRRHFLAALLAAPLAAFAQGAPTELKVLGFGGKLDTIFQAALVDFEKERNVKFRFIPSSPPDTAAKLVATMAKPEYDLALFDNLYYSLASSKGALAKVDEKIATHYKDLDPRAVPAARDGYTVGFYFTGLMYNPKEFEKRKWGPPQSWNDIFDPKYCKVLGLGTVQGSFGLNTLVMLAGGDLNKLPDAIEKVGKLKECVPTLESNSSKLEEKTQIGEYALSVAVSTRVPTLMKQGYPVKFVIPKEGTVIGYGTMTVVKGGPNEKLAHEAANYLLSPKAQRVLMDEAFYMPSNKTIPLSKELVSYGFPTPEQVARAVAVKGEVVVEERRNWKRLEDRAMAK